MLATQRGGGGRDEGAYQQEQEAEDRYRRCGLWQGMQLLIAHTRLLSTPTMQIYSAWTTYGFRQAIFLNVKKRF